MKLYYTQKLSFQLTAQFILLLLGVSAAHRSFLQGAKSVKNMHSVL